MVRSGLLVCSFFIKNRYERNNSKAIELNNPIHINDIEDEVTYPCIWNIFHNFLSAYINPKDDANSMKLFSINQDSIKEYNTTIYHTVSFIVNSGSYGMEGELTDRNTKQVNYHRTRDDADIKQFYALIFIPKDADNIKVQKGIFIFQSIGTYGIKTITTKQMKEYFADINLTLETRSVSIGLFLRKLLEEERLSKIILLKNNISPDPCDNMLISTGREEKVYIKPRLKESWIQKLLDYVDGKKDSTIFEVNDDIYEDICISFNISGRTRKARLKDIDKFSLTEDIPDSIYNNGIINEEEFIEYMIETAKTYKEKMVFRI